MKGSDFVRRVTPLSRPDREKAILSAVADKQHLPLAWVEIPFTFTDKEGKSRSGCFCATADYFAIGTPDDFVRVPMSPLTAQRIADMLGASLPTTRMVDLVWKQAAVKLAPQPMTPPSYPYDASMLSVQRFDAHNKLVEQQRKGRPGLVRGHKKDVVLSNRLETQPDQVAIYGWQDAKTGKPIQPLSLVHENSYADYSHGIAFIHPRMRLDGVDVAVADVLREPALAGALSDEGVLCVLRQPGVPQASSAAAATPGRAIDYTLPLGERAVAWEIAELAAGARPADARIVWYFSGCERRDPKTGVEAPLTGLGASDDWCAASACAATAACSIEGEAPPYPRYGYRASGQELVDDAKAGGAWHDVADAKAKKWAPRKGDLAIFLRTGWHRHVARVEVPPDASGKYCTIGGNEGPAPGVWKETQRQISDADLLGFIAFPQAAATAVQVPAPATAPGAPSPAATLAAATPAAAPAAASATPATPAATTPAAPATTTATATPAATTAATGTAASTVATPATATAAATTATATPAAATATAATPAATTATATPAATTATATPATATATPATPAAATPAVTTATTAKPAATTPATTTPATTTATAATPATTTPAKRPRHAPPPMETMGSYRLTTLLIGTMAAMVAIGLAPRLPGGAAWGIEVALMCAFFAIVGYATCGKALGVLIDGQRLVSLSRFQAVLWTIIVLSAYFTMAMRRIHLPDPLGIAIDWHLWALMGISTTSLVGTPLIQGMKKKRQPKEGSFTATAAALGQDAADVDADRSGIMYANPTIDDAGLSDMFGGDEVGNAAYVDLGKVQMFFFTMVAALIYVVLLYNELDTKTAVEMSSFPVLAPGLIAVLGLSHAGSLGAAATSDTPVSTPAAGATASAATADPAVQKILEVVGRIDRTTFNEARTSKQILAAVGGGATPAPPASGNGSANPTGSVGQA